MPKKTVKHKTVRENLTKVEIEARREAAALRRLKAQQRRIVTLSRDLRRAVRAADGARLDAARELCADTGYAVFGIAEVEDAQRKAALTDEAVAQLDARDRQNVADPAKAGAAQG